MYLPLRTAKYKGLGEFVGINSVNNRSRRPSPRLNNRPNPKSKMYFLAALAESYSAHDHHK